MGGKLPREFYTRPDVVEVARDLVGKVLVTNIDNQLCRAMIVETEAYNGRTDRACHAFNKRTARTEVMYGPGGVAYVYLCYGIHNLFNIVTNEEGLADAVLIRAVQPIEGIEHMLQRRKMNKPEKRLTSGPGTLTTAMGIGLRDNGMDLAGDQIWLEYPAAPQKVEIQTSTRIGVEYAGSDALLPWRFVLKNNIWISSIR